MFHQAQTSSTVILKTSNKKVKIIKCDKHYPCSIFIFLNWVANFSHVKITQNSVPHMGPAFGRYMTNSAKNSYMLRQCKIAANIIDFSKNS